MIEEVEDLRVEGVEFRDLLRSLGADDWRRPTPFKNWTPWDVAAHLHFSDRAAVNSLRSPEEFHAFTDPIIAANRKGASLQDLTRDLLGPLDAATMLATWERCFFAMCDLLAARNPKDRLAWFGPDMGVRMFTTARLMETWAHAQDVYDLLGRQRVYGDRIRHVALLGVKTYGWTFANRGLPVPGPEPYVRLTAPSGAIWEWNEPSNENRVAGLAAEFCHVVTQGRNVQETSLEVVGEPATRWMAIAQCFAGSAEDPPAPGARTIHGRR